MFFTATMTHCTTCFRPLARLMALQRSNVLQLQKMEIANTIAKHLMDNKHLRGRRTLRTLRIFTTEIAPELRRENIYNWELDRGERDGHSYQT